MHSVNSWPAATVIGPMAACGLFVDDDPPPPPPEDDEHAMRPPMATRRILRMPMS